MAKNPIDAINPFPNQEGDTREDRIRRRAHELWQAEGMPAGRESDHWLAAEREEADKERSEPSLGEPIVPGTSIPGIRSSADSASTDGDEAVAAPKTAGAPKPAADTSRSPVANRDVAGPVRLAPRRVRRQSRSPDPMVRTGRCQCGEVRYEVDGEPLRVGLCHCTDCRQTSGSAFTMYAVWPSTSVHLQLSRRDIPRSLVLR